MGEEVDLRLQKKSDDASTWEFYINGVKQWEKSHSNYANPTSSIDIGIEVQSPTFTASTVEINSIYVKKTSWTTISLWPWWNPSLKDATPERYHIDKIGNNTYNQKTWGYGLYSRTSWNGPAEWENSIGKKVHGKTKHSQIREGEYYSGVSGIDSIAWKTTNDGEQAIFAVGWHQADRAEYVMEIPSNPFQLGIIAISDKPGPVL